MAYTAASESVMNGFPIASKLCTGQISTSQIPCQHCVARTMYCP